MTVRASGDIIILSLYYKAMMQTDCSFRLFQRVCDTAESADKGLEHDTVAECAPILFYAKECRVTALRSLSGGFSRNAGGTVELFCFAPVLGWGVLFFIAKNFKEIDYYD